MYTKTILASAALMATTALAGPGSAVIINSCSYPVYLSAVPAAGGGYDEVSKTLDTSDTWSTTWTELSNGDGWSLKLSKDTSLTDILQYEYTFHNDGIIWYDLSCVNGNPWAGDWEITASGAGCSPRQAYYRYDTDDAFGMQSCGSDATITVTLCSSDSSTESVVSSAVATTPTTTAAPVATSTHTQATYTTTKANALGFDGDHFYNAAVAVDKTSTTLATVATPVVGEDGIVTEIVTVIETAIAYETYVPGKRHVHHPNHPQFR